MNNLLAHLRHRPLNIYMAGKITTPSSTRVSFRDSAGQEWEDTFAHNDPRIPAVGSQYWNGVALGTVEYVGRDWDIEDPWRTAFGTDKHGGSLAQAEGAIDPNTPWPVQQHAIFGVHHYTGPYLSSYGHGMVGEGGAHALEPRTWSRDLIVTRCLEAIRNSDLLFVWAHRPDIHGTLVEVGYAKAFGKAIFVAYPHPMPDLWFLIETATDTVCAPDPAIALQVLLKRHGLRTGAWKRQVSR